MIHIEKLSESLGIFQALDSSIRLSIIEMLNEHGKLNMNTIATKLSLSNPAVTMHIRKLEECGIVGIDAENGKHGIQKVCYLKEDKLLIDLLQSEIVSNFYDIEIGVGQYSSYQVHPTCGIATKDNLIGEFDDPRYFASPERMNAGALWFTKGFVEYMVPNYTNSSQKIVEIQISAELASEAPGFCEHWPSDIYFFFNDVELGYWTSPGDFGETRGILNPAWYYGIGEHGVLKLLTINERGTFMDGRKLSETNIEELNLSHKSEFSVRFESPDYANNQRGISIYGKNFGNYNQDIKVRVLYKQL